MFGFTIIALGQFVSMLGTGMTRFAITIYAWQGTGEATALALVGFFAFGPSVLLSPIAGAIVDRANRKLVMMLSDLAAGLMTLAVRRISAISCSRRFILARATIQRSLWVVIAAFLPVANI